MEENRTPISPLLARAGTTKMLCKGVNVSAVFFVAVISEYRKNHNISIGTDMSL